MKEIDDICTDSMNDTLSIFAFILLGGSTIGFLCSVLAICRSTRDSSSSSGATTWNDDGRTDDIESSLMWDKLKIGKLFFEDLLSLVLNVSVLTFILKSGGLSFISIMSLCVSAGTLLLDACFELVIRPTCNKRGCSKSCDIAIKMTCIWLLLLMGLSIWALAVFLTAEEKLHVSVINDKCGFFDVEWAWDDEKASFSRNGIKCIETSVDGEDTMRCTGDDGIVFVDLGECDVYSNVTGIDLCYDSVTLAWDLISLE